MLQASRKRACAKVNCAAMGKKVNNTTQLNVVRNNEKKSKQCDTTTCRTKKKLQWHKPLKSKVERLH